MAQKKPSKKSKSISPTVILDAEDESIEQSSTDDSEPDESDIEITGDENLPAELSDPDFKAVSPQDPLRRYLDDVSKHPMLDHEEEIRLARDLIKTGNLDSAKKLVTSNLRLVVKIAFEYRRFYHNVMDLIQEGNVGLMKAVSKYEPEKGVKLGYYASWWIRSYILKYLLDNFRLVKIGTTQAQKKLFYHLVREREKLEAQGIKASPKLLAERLDVKEKDIIEMSQRLSSSGSEISIDAPRESIDGKSTSLADLIASGAEGADSAMERDEWLQILIENLPEFEKSLTPKELAILQQRILSDNPKTLQEVADQYSLTRERVRQIESKIIEKLRDYLKPWMK